MPTGTGKTGIIATVSLLCPEAKCVLVLTPWVALRDQMIEDVREEFWKAIRTKAPGGKSVERYGSSGALAWLRRKSSEPIVLVSTIQALQRAHAEDRRTFDLLRTRIDVVLVDEGHREPAPHWARAVRDLARPIVLFTATPYRNDHKLFRVDPAHVTVFTHKEAITGKYIRSVRFEAAPPPDDPARFVDSLLAYYQGPFKRHAPNTNGVPRVIVRCETANDVTEITRLLRHREQSALGIHDRYTDENDDAFADRVPNPRKSHETFWVHQFKLMEGLDDPRFSLLAMYQPFRNGRSLIQQIGRIVRNPGRRPGQTAVVFADPHSGQRSYWEGYLAYEEEYEKNPDRDERRTVLAAITHNQPAIVYAEGQYRRRLELDTCKPDDEFLVPSSATVLEIRGKLDLAALANAVKREWLDLDVDVRRFDEWAGSWLLVNVAFGNSPLLAQSALTEHSLGCTLIRRVGHYLFFYDSHGRRSEAILDAGSPVASDRLQRLFLGPGARLTQVSLRNSDLGRHAVRRRSLQAFSVADTAPGLADHAHFCSTASGYPRDAVRERGRRYVGFSRSRITDPTTDGISIGDWGRWTEEVARALGRDVEPPAVFDRFAQRVSAPDAVQAEPVNILLDIIDVEDHFSHEGNQQPLQIDDLCVPITKNRFDLSANGISYAVTVHYEPDRQRYELDAPELERAVGAVRNAGRRDNLVSYLNREQAFRIVPRAPGLIYARRNFYRPRLPLTGTKGIALTSVLEPVSKLASLTSEKGEPGSASSSGWSDESVFGWIDAGCVGSSIAQFMKQATLIVCTDLGTEVADFVVADEDTLRIAFVHAKGKREASQVSATKLADVTAQATKNLEHLSPFSVVEPPIKSWGKPWNGGTTGTVKARVRRGARDAPAKLWSRMRTLVRDPRTTREVWIVVGKTLSKSKFVDALEKADPVAIQILYALQSTWSAVASIGVTFRVLCSP